MAGAADGNNARPNACNTTRWALPLPQGEAVAGPDPGHSIGEGRGRGRGGYFWPVKASTAWKQASSAWLSAISWRRKAFMGPIMSMARSISGLAPRA